MNEKILDKVRKLLAVGHNTNNANEAAAFIAQAQRLMTEHRIDDAALLIEGDQADEEISDAHALNVTGQRVYWIGILGRVVAEANGCRVYWQNAWNYETQKKQSTLRVVGHTSNADATRYLFTYCRNEIDRLAKAERAALKREGEPIDRTYMSSFRDGCVDAIREAVKAERDALDLEMRKHAKLSGERALVRLDGALVRINQQAKDVGTWLDENMNLRTARRRGGNVRPDGWASGRLAGEGIYPGRQTDRIGAPAPRLERGR